MAAAKTHLKDYSVYQLLFCIQVIVEVCPEQLGKWRKYYESQDFSTIFFYFLQSFPEV